MIKTIAMMHVRSTLWYISLPSSAKQKHKMTTLKVLLRTWAYYDTFPVLFFNLNAVCPHSVKIEGVGIIDK